MAAIFTTEPVPTGRVTLKTTLGDIELELWCKEIPKACRNFVQLCLEGYYDECIIHRVVPNFIAQTGDPTGTGEGGESTYDEPFEDEFNQRIKFNKRGLLGMANLGEKNTNGSQFFFTLDATPELQGKNTIFGRVTIDSIYRLLPLNSIQFSTDPSTPERPLYPPKIISAEVDDHPFKDIVPRITAEEKREQTKARKEAKEERDRQKGKPKRKKVSRNTGLLSFGETAEEDIATRPTGPISAHDLVNDDTRLSKEVRDDRGLRDDFGTEMGGPSAGTRKDKGKGKDKDREKEIDAGKKGDKESKRDGDETLERIRALRKEHDKENPSESDKVKAEIAKVQAGLKKMAKPAGSGSESSDSEGGGKTRRKKPKYDGVSLLQQERAKFAAKAEIGGAAVGKGKGKEKEGGGVVDSLKSFNERMEKAAKMAALMSKDDEDEGMDGAEEGGGEDGKVPEAKRLGVTEDVDGDEEGWMTHSLRFRKDANIDIHKTSEYEVIDPRERDERSKLTLDEARKEGERRRKNIELGIGAGALMGNGRDKAKDGNREWDRDRDRDRGGRGGRGERGGGKKGGGRGFGGRGW